MQSHHEPMQNQKQQKETRQDKKRGKKGYNREALREAKRSC